MEYFHSVLMCDEGDALPKIQGVAKKLVHFSEIPIHVVQDLPATIFYSFPRALTA
jgi:hypothetical protein